MARGYWLIDALYGAPHESGDTVEWNMWPFNGDWPSSLFASQDAVAIDSVAFDFMYEEWDPCDPCDAEYYPHMSGAEDYLHEAALADDPCSGLTYDPDGDGNGLDSLGVHEHWNNATDKEYSRNLGSNSGIELISLRQRVDGDIDTDGDVDYRDFARFAGEWMKSGCGECGGADFTGEGDVGLDDLQVLCENWLAGF
jgi:hypothetical protein